MTDVPTERVMRPDWNASPPFITSTSSGNGDYYVTVKVHSIKELHAAHDLVLKAFIGAARALQSHSTGDDK